MYKSALFSGFEGSNVQKMVRCLGVKFKNCNTNEIIMSYKESPEYLYIVLSGTAELATYDYDGNKTVLERFIQDSMFGDMFFKPLGADEFSVFATSPCEVMYFRYYDAINLCENVCKEHKKFLDNLFMLMSKKLLTQSRHIEILTKRTIREKLINYLEHIEAESGSFSFLLPMSLSALADYLSIDRSAMQREIKRLNDEGVIISKGKKITLIKK